MDSFDEYEKRGRKPLMSYDKPPRKWGQKITYECIYSELFLIYKKLENELSMLKYIVYVSKSTIYSLEKENKNMSEEINWLR